MMPVVQGSGGGGALGSVQSKVLTKPSRVTEPSEVNCSRAVGVVPTRVGASEPRLPLRLARRGASAVSPA